MGKAPPAWAFALFLAALALAVYGPVAAYPFVHFDDSVNVTGNALVQRGLTWEGVRMAFSHPPEGGWPHPFAVLSHMLDCQVYGLRAGGHHMTSVFLHIAAAILLFFALLRMTADAWRSSFVSAVFAVHPLQVESVAWVSERKNTLNGLFFMLTLWLYARYAKRPSARAYASMCAAFVLSLLARSVMVGLPCILLGLDCWPLKRKEGLRPLVVEKLPLFFLSVLCAVVALRTADAISSLELIPWPARLAGALIATLAYLRQTAWPTGLCAFYPYALGIPLWKAAAAGLVLLAVTAACALESGRRPWLAVGWLWFLAALAPFSGLVQVGAQAMADRYMYLPLVGLAIAAAWGVPARLGARAKTLGAAATVVALMIAASLQVRYWQDGVTLFSRAAALHPESALAHDHLGAELYDSGDMDGAIAELKTGLALYPRQADARNDLALALMVKGENAEAERQLTLALAARPDSEGIRRNLEAVRRLLAKPHAARP